MCGILYEATNNTGIMTRDEVLYYRWGMTKRWKWYDCISAKLWLVDNHRRSENALDISEHFQANMSDKVTALREGKYYPANRSDNLSEAQ